MGKVEHFEVPVDDFSRAKKFYEEVFGWQFKDVEGIEHEYAFALTTESDERMVPKDKCVINGGMYKRSPRGEGPVIVITVKSMDQTLEKLKEKGREIVFGPHKIGDMGVYAQFRDSEGNLMGLWESLWAQE